MKRVRINITVGQDANCAQDAYDQLVKVLDTLGTTVSYETEWSQVDDGAPKVYR